MIRILFALCLLVMAGIIQLYKHRTNIVVLAVFSLCGFFCFNMVVDTIFFALDVFSFERSLVVQLISELICAIGLLYLRTGKAGATIKDAFGKIDFDLKPVIIPIVICLITIPFILVKNDLYSMGQDQGTYQVKALALYGGYNSNYIEMEEFQNFSDPDDRQKYLDFIYAQNNFYLPYLEDLTDYDASHFEEIVGTIHGLPTYSALLALWSLVFGLSSMLEVQTCFHIGTILLSYIAAKRYCRSKAAHILIPLLTSLSPINIWLAKSSLTEGFLTMLVAMFICMIWEKSESYISWIPVLVFGCVHISIFAFMPVIALVYVMLYVSTKDKGHLVSMIISAFSYMFTALWSFAIAPYYTYGNYSFLKKLTLEIINEKNLVYVAGGASITMALVAVAFWNGKLADKISTVIQKKHVQGLISPLIRLFLLVSLAFFLYKGVIKADYVRYVEYLQISSYIYMSGLIIIPLIYIFVLIKPERLYNTFSLVIFVLFAYCVVFYSMVMRLDLIYYYYYARYCAMFLLVIFLLWAMIMEGSFSGKRLTMWVAVPFIIALVSFMPYDTGLIYQKDHSRLEWDRLNEVCAAIGSNDAFIVGPDEQQIVWIYPVKFLTGCDVYHADEDLNKEITYLKSLGIYDNVFYMDYSGKLEEEPLFTRTNHYSLLDPRHITMPLTPIPLDYVEYQLELSLWKFQMNS